MKKESIVEKLRDVLTKQPFTEESQVLYLMVGIRKIIQFDSSKVANFKFLKFYCDWLLHIEKDQNQAEIKNIIEPLYNGAKEWIELSQDHVLNNAIERFLYFEDLKNGLVRFFNDEKLPNGVCYGTDCWENYVELMCGILSEHAINNPIPEVKSVVLFSQGNRKIGGRIDFKNPISDSKGNPQEYYEFYRHL